MVDHLTEAERLSGKFAEGSFFSGGKHVQQVLRGVSECPVSGAGALGSRVHAV